MARVFLGVGHGGKDPGAVGNGLHEADLNLYIALSCRDELERHGVVVGISRTKDENDDINEEIRECNAFAPDLAIDIHNNAGGGDGAEVYHHHKGGKSAELAADILHAIVLHTGQQTRGLKTRLNAAGNDYYGFIRSVKAPSVIVECAFIDNAKDIAIIDTAAEQKKMGVAIARGILKTLGIAYKEPTPAAPAAPAKDNTPDDYAAEAVKWAIEEGILKGDANGNYNLHGTVTRQDVLVFLSRVFEA